MPILRLARRRGYESQPNNLVGSATVRTSSTVTYSENWAGAVWTENDGTFTTVTGTFTVPTPSGSDGGASAWVGIDGNTHGDAILQTGVNFKISDKKVSYKAWYQWHPDKWHSFSDLTISAGDNIKLTVTASSTTSGTAVIENLTTNQKASQDITSTHALHERNAEWIVEDYTYDGSRVHLVDFGSVTFTDATASGASDTASESSDTSSDSSNTVYTPSGASILEIEQNGEVLTSVSTSGSSVTITYTGDSSDSSSDSSSN